MKRTIFLKILISLFIIMVVFVNSSNAMSIGNLTGNTSSTNEIQKVGNKAVKVTSTIGSICSVIVITILGIKYMFGSAEEKAEYKKTLMPFLIGATFIFAASNIANIIYEVAINIKQ